MELPFTTDVSTWTWDTVTQLSKHNENQYLEYKQTIHPPDDTDAEKKEWDRTLEREITAFANANGGIIVFGVDDDGEPTPFDPPDHEVKQSVTRLIQNTRPLADVEISDPIRPPSDDTDRIVLAIRVLEAKRKPVLTSDAAVYRRINDRKEPMSREQMESLFVEHDRKQQAVRQLEMEIDRFYDMYEGGRSDFGIHSEAPPNYHLLNTDALKDALRQNAHFHTDEDIQKVVSRVFGEIREIESERKHFNRAMEGRVSMYQDSKKDFYRDRRRELDKYLSRLETELERLAEEANLQVKLSVE